MTRIKLPNRRAGETVDIWHDGQKYTACIGSLDGSPVEVFITAARADSTLAAIASDIGLLISQALRYGVPIERYRQSVARTDTGEPASIAGAVLDVMCSGVSQ